MRRAPVLLASRPSATSRLAPWPFPRCVRWKHSCWGRGGLGWWRRRWRVHANACAPYAPNASVETLGNLLSRTGLWSVRDNNFLTFLKNFTNASWRFWSTSQMPPCRLFVTLRVRQLLGGLLRVSPTTRTACIVCAHDFIKSETSLLYFKNAVTSSHAYTRRPFMSHGRSQGGDMIIYSLSDYIQETSLEPISEILGPSSALFSSLLSSSRLSLL